GHFTNPYSIVRELSMISEIAETGFAVISIGQNSLGVGRIIGNFNNKKIMNALKEKKIEGLIVLGGSPFDFIPGFGDMFDYLNFVMSTDFFKGSNMSECVIPSAFCFEKRGSFISLEEKLVNLGESISPVGEAISDGDFISRLLLKLTGSKVKAKVSIPKTLPLREGSDNKKPSSITNKKYPFTVVGIGLPFHHHRGEVTRKVKWNKDKKEPYVFINPVTARKYSLKNKVKIETSSGSFVFKIEDCGDLPFRVPEDVIAVPLHFPQNMELFVANFDLDDIISPGAEKARIIK
ncbi:MAG: hypothetical protein P8Z50_00230, partial [candidate division WOR-3 bacterium]